MTARSIPFGTMLRRWRERRRMTQADLAHGAQSSTRHLSCLETGRAQPSRAMIGHLADALEIPLRERNALLLAAGYAPAFGERAIDDLDAAKAAMDRVIRAHAPYPAFVVDRHWNVVLSNGALPQLYEGCAEALLASPVNAMRLILHPDGMAPRIINYAEWRDYSLDLLRRQIEANGDPALRALRAEIAAYPEPDANYAALDFTGADRLATPLRVHTRLGMVAFLNTLTVFGTAHDLTLAELTLEMLFPADEETAAVVAEMIRETGDQSHFGRGNV